MSTLESGTYSLPGSCTHVTPRTAPAKSPADHSNLHPSSQTDGQRQGEQSVSSLHHGNWLHRSHIYILIIFEIQGKRIAGRINTTRPAFAESLVLAGDHTGVAERDGMLFPRLPMQEQAEAGACPSSRAQRGELVTWPHPQSAP